MTSRRKGKDGENELAQIINRKLGIRCLARNLVQSRNGGHDLVVTDTSTLPAQRLDQLAIEVKRHKQVKPADIKSWWQQAAKQALDIKKVPVLFYRADREDWQAMIPLSEKLDYKDARHCITMTMDLFISIINDPDLCPSSLTHAG